MLRSLRWSQASSSLVPYLAQDDQAETKTSWRCREVKNSATSFTGEANAPLAFLLKEMQMEYFPPVASGVLSLGSQHSQVREQAGLGRCLGLSVQCGMGSSAKVSQVSM